VEIDHRGAAAAGSEWSGHVGKILDEFIFKVGPGIVKQARADA
jgi:hypothetical protein